MRALVLKDYGQMVVEERPKPTPKPREILLRICATGICGSDLHGYTGESGRRIPGQVMGHESVGTIAALGEAVDEQKFRVGQVATFNPVIVTGPELESFRGREQHAPGKMIVGVAQDLVSSFAEFVAVPDRNVVVLPDEMPISYGALIEPLAVALHAIRRVRVSRDDKLLVVGGGPIGQSSILAARAEGVKTIIVSEVDQLRRDLCKELGALVVDPTQAPVADQVLQAFGELADVAVDAVGISQTVSDALSATKFGGSICLVGMGSPFLDLDAYRVSTEERIIVGSFTYTAQDFRDAATWVASAPTELVHLISREVSLDDAPEAFAALARRDGTPGKVLVRLDS
jgi:threonine dehydrogenase-like Zn-dependent dehydrogenase